MSTRVDVIPLAQPVIGEAEEQAVLEVLRSGQLSLGPRVPAFEAAFAERVGARHACAVSSGTTGLHLALRAIGVAAGDEVVTTPFSFVATANAVVYEGAHAGVRRHRPGHAGSRPGRRRGGDHADGRARCCRSTSSATRPTCPPSSATACRSSRTPRRPSARATPTARRSAAAATRPIFGFYANKQLTTGEGGMVTLGSAEHKVRIDSERNQGRAPDMDWLDHDRLGFNYRLSDIACALGLAQLDRLDDMLAARAQVAGWYREALAGVAEERGVALPCPDAGGNVRGWFVFVVQLPDGVDRDATMLALREHGVQSKPYLPAIHLMSLYRERFGHREGEFPVCERVADQSLALPFFPAMTQGQVARVAAALGQVIAA